jgi:hypothetical protein
MWDRKSQYINLKDRSESRKKIAEKRYQLFQPLIQLSGPRRGGGWKLSRGISIQQEDETDRSPWIDLPSVFRAVVFGVSFLVYVIGNLFKNPGGRGHMNGGRA